MQVLRQDATDELELSGPVDELRRLASALRSGRTAQPLDTSGDPAPYDRALSSLETARTSGGVAVRHSADGEVLTIEGGPDQLAVLAEVFEDFADEGDLFAHLHLEYLPDHEFLSPRTQPLVVALTA
jgi:hypothetical protein